MFRIRIEELIDKDINTVFNAISDHENYKQFPGITNSILLEPGHSEKNGTGALRKIVAGSLHLFERITYFDKPNAMSYQIEKSKPIPLRHDKGEIKLSQEGNQTRVVWVSEGHINVPILGSLILDRQVERQARIQFQSMLKAI